MTLLDLPFELALHVTSYLSAPCDLLALTLSIPSCSPLLELLVNEISDDIANTALIASVRILSTNNRSGSGPLPNIGWGGYPKVTLPWLQQFLLILTRQKRLFRLLVASPGDTIVVAPEDGNWRNEIWAWPCLQIGIPDVPDDRKCCPLNLAAAMGVVDALVCMIEQLDCAEAIDILVGNHCMGPLHWAALWSRWECVDFMVRWLQTKTPRKQDREECCASEDHEDGSAGNVTEADSKTFIESLQLVVYGSTTTNASALHFCILALKYPGHRLADVLVTMQRLLSAAPPPDPDPKSPIEKMTPIDCLFCFVMSPPDIIVKTLMTAYKPSEATLYHAVVNGQPWTTISIFASPQLITPENLRCAFHHRPENFRLSVAVELYRCSPTDSRTGLWNIVLNRIAYDMASATTSCLLSLLCSSPPAPDINQPTFEGGPRKTPLFAAVQYGQLFPAHKAYWERIVLILLKHGADPQWKSLFYGVTVTELASRGADMWVLGIIGCPSKPIPLQNPNELTTDSLDEALSQITNIRPSPGARVDVLAPMMTTNIPSFQIKVVHSFLGGAEFDGCQVLVVPLGWCVVVFWMWAGKVTFKFFRNEAPPWCYKWLLWQFAEALVRNWDVISGLEEENKRANVLKRIRRWSRGLQQKNATS